MSLFKKKIVAAGPLSIRQVFERAAKIVRNQWIQGNFVDCEGGQCLVQAIGTAVGRPNMQEDGAPLPHECLVLIDAKLSGDEYYRTIRTYVAICKSTNDEVIQAAAIQWNDYDGRVQSEVIGLLESIARDLARTEAAPDTDELQRMSDDLDQLWEMEQPSLHATIA